MSISEKQLNLINKLLNEKAVTYGDLQYKYELGTGKVHFLSDNIEELDTKQASWLIGQLLSAPKRPSEAYLNAKKERFEKACDKYEKLIQWAKDNGVSVRARSKKETVLSKIREAGLINQIPQELL